MLLANTLTLSGNSLTVRRNHPPGFFIAPGHPWLSLFFFSLKRPSSTRLGVDRFRSVEIGERKHIKAGGVAMPPKKKYLVCMTDLVLTMIITAVVLIPFYYLLVPRKREFYGRKLSEQDLRGVRNTGGAIFFIIWLVVVLALSNN